MLMGWPSWVRPEDFILFGLLIFTVAVVVRLRWNARARSRKS